MSEKYKLRADERRYQYTAYSEQEGRRLHNFPNPETYRSQYTPYTAPHSSQHTPNILQHPCPATHANQYTLPHVSASRASFESGQYSYPSSSVYTNQYIPPYVSASPSSFALQNPAGRHGFSCNNQPLEKKYTLPSNSIGLHSTDRESNPTPSVQNTTQIELSTSITDTVYQQSLPSEATEELRHTIKELGNFVLQIVHEKDLSSSAAKIWENLVFRAQAREAIKELYPANTEVCSVCVRRFSVVVDNMCDTCKHIHKVKINIPKRSVSRVFMQRAGNWIQCAPKQLPPPAPLSIPSTDKITNEEVIFQLPDGQPEVCLKCHGDIVFDFNADADVWVSFGVKRLPQGPIHVECFLASQPEESSPNTDFCSKRKGGGEEQRQKKF